MPTVPYADREKIKQQVLKEIQFARTHKQGKIKNWKLNEDMYYSRKIDTKDSRANIDLGRMAEFVHTLLSKIDSPLIFKYTKRKESQLKRVKYLNALRKSDQDSDDWDIKDLVGKKQGAIYGRAVYSYYAESENGYCSHLDNIDVYDFLVDPAGGGIDYEKARYLGDYGVVLSRQDLEAGVKNKTYLKTETQRLLSGGSNATEMSVEVTNQNNRTAAQNTGQVNKQITDEDKFVFWRWGTTYGGKRYYVLITERGGEAVRVDPIEEVFESGLWWYWGYAVFPDLTEHWTPSYCDYVREIFMAQGVAVNQAFDNTEQVNKPQKVVDVGAVENLAELKYQRGGNYIKSKAGYDASKAVQLLNVPAIDTPLKIFELLEGIQEKASGVNASAKGVATDEKATVYEGNAANTADRFGLLNKSYAFGYKRFAKLYEWGVREHLTQKTSVDIIGPDGVETTEISKRDIFRKGESFGLIVEANDAELQLSESDKKFKTDFLTGILDTPSPEQGIVNPKKAFEMLAALTGFTEEEIRELLDTSDFGDADLMSEAEEDIEALLEGNAISPNQGANTAYKQRFVDYMRDNVDNIPENVVPKMFAYIESLDTIIIRNMARQAQQVAFKARLAALGTTPNASQQPLKSAVPSPIPTAPPSPTISPPDGSGAIQNGGQIITPQY